jgi:hypothetical protein
MLNLGAGVLVDTDKIQPTPDKAQPSMVQPSEARPKEQNEENDEEKEYKENKDVKGISVWSSVPTFDDQYKRFPETTRLVGPVVGIFDVAVAEQLNDLNNLLAKQQPESAPSVILASRKENFYEGKWLMLLEYFRVEYKQLVSTT